MRSILNFVVPILVAAVAAPPLHAQEQAIELTGDIQVERIVTEENGESAVQRVAPQRVVPGDRLIFGTDYKNTSAETVENFVVTNPLPSSVRLASDSGAEMTVSVDGGENWGTLAALTIAGEDGVARPAEHGDVTHVRWTLNSVAPGESGRLEFPAIVR